MPYFKQYLESIGEIGFVEEAMPSLAYITGLPGAHPGEIIYFESGETGEILSLSRNRIEVLVFAANTVKVGTRVVRSGKAMQIPIGTNVLGQIIDPFGNALDKLKVLKESEATRSIDIEPLGINARKKINRSFETGVTLVDMLVPLGRGQRELIIGDRKTGKSSFLLQTLSNQAKSGTICIYAAIGKKKLDIKKVEEYCIATGIMDKVVIIASSPEDPSSVIYLTPYSAMAISEYFKDQGHDVLLILDDLTNHAKFYREISLLAKRFPGRNAYPADIFYAHAKLLERAGNFKSEKGEVSITCLPVVETVQGDITGYIQTNLMSMTDGHIYFDVDLFTKGKRPAINPFLSVTRVGRQTQTDLKRTISRELISFLTLQERIENFTRFGAEVNVSIREMLATGERIKAFFTQHSEEVIHSNIQIFLFSLLWYGRWKDVSVTKMILEMKQIKKMYETDEELRKQINDLIEKSQSLNTLLTHLKQNADEMLKAVALLTAPVIDTVTKKPVTTEQKPVTQPA